MPRIPDEFALGGLPSAQSGRPIATYDTTAIGRGVAELGHGIASLARVAAANQSETDTLEEARANSNYLIQTKRIRDELSTATNPDELETKYGPQLKQAYDESAGLITNPRKREMWSVKAAPSLEDHTLAVGSKVYDLQKTKQIADTYDRLDQIRNAALTTTDPAERAKLIDSGQGLIRGLKDASYIDDVAEQKLRKGWTTNYAIAAIEAQSPEERVKTLSTSVQTRDQTLDRFKAIEGSGRNPNSSAEYDFQFTKKTWLETVQAHRPDLMQGRSAEAVIALRADPKLAREMAGHLMDDNAAVLRSQGVAPTPSSLYLAHFLGAGDAAKVLKAAPGTPISDIVQPESIAANKSVLQGKTAETVIGWASGKMGAGNNRSAGGPVDFIPEDKRVEMLHTANQEVAGGLIDHERRSKLEQQQIKDKSDQAQQEIFNDLYSDKPTMTVQSIAKNKDLLPAAKTTMIAAAKAALGDDAKADKTYGSAFMNVYQRIHMPDGALEKITDPSSLYSLVGQKDGLTVAGVDKLVTEINSRKTPEGVAEAEMKRQFLQTAKGQISGSDEGLHIKDPKGDELYLKFLANALPSYEAGKKAGKTAAQLLNPDSPDYIGKAITQYKRPMNQWFSDVVNGGASPAAAATPAAFEPAAVKSLDELVSAYRAGKVSRAIASEIAIAKGWASAGPAAAVPVSQ